MATIQPSDDDREVELARATIILGNRYPYDLPDEARGEITRGNLAPAVDHAERWNYRAARAIVCDLRDRRDIKQGFNGVDEAIRSEIIERLALIIALCTEGIMSDEPDRPL